MRGLEGSSIDPSSGRFFREIEALSKALNVESKSASRRSRAAPPSGSRSLSTGRTFAPSNPGQKDKKSSSLWNWKPLKALSHIRRRRFECVFSLRVHAIENLPPALADSSLCVHWKRTKADSVSVSTRPADVFRGAARFEETLNHGCSVYGSRSRAQGSAKYEARNFLIYATVVGAPGLDLGKHRVDLTRLLPLNIEELEEGRSSGKWSTVFRLSGKAIGASLSVSFSFSVVAGDDRSQKPEDTKGDMNSQFVDDGNGLGKVSEPVVKIMEIDEQDNSAEMKSCVLPHVTEPFKGNVKESEGSELIVEIEHRAEISKEASLKDSAEGIDRKQEEETAELAILLGDPNLFEISTSELAEIGCPKVDDEDPEMLNNKTGSTKNRSCSLDDLTDEVAGEFLSMLDEEYSSSGLSSDGCPESPREQLWKQFKTESLFSSSHMFGLDIEAYEEMNWGNGEGVFDFSSLPYEADSENQIESKSKAQMLEDAETEALLREWGLDEKVFDGSPPGSMNGFGSPIHLPPEETPELPPLGENLGPFVQTKDGGFLRSMSPNLFKDSKINGNLIMQVSKPVVMPAEMGSDNMGILQHLASIGVEKLSMQASKLMPLEEITGGLMQQLSWETSPEVEAFQRQNKEKDSQFDLNSSGKNVGETTDEYVSLEDLAPLAMDKIEALSIEGLKIQSGMSDGEAPSNMTKQSVCEGKEAGNLTSLGLEGAVGLRLLDVEDKGDNFDGLMGLSISLDEWMQLDMGIVEEECEISDRTSKILAAHHAKSAEYSSRCWSGDRRGKNSSRRGLLESNFTVALMVQLRDPLRNYEPVGTPMLALIQVERVFLPPKPKIYSTVSDKSETEEDTELEKEAVFDAIPRFKVTEVHVAGLKAEEPGKRRHWGSSVQQQSGSRWLLANGMGKLNKNPLMKSNASAKSQPGETLWSISSRVQGDGPKLKEVPASKTRSRNPGFWFFR